MAEDKRSGHDMGGPRGEPLARDLKTGLKRENCETLSDLGVAEIAIPKKILTLENIPLLSTGKIDYVTLEEILKDIDPDS